MGLQTAVKENKLSIGQNLALGFQHVFAMFGATVLVPLLTGLDPTVAFFTSGIGTLLFMVLTKWQVPAYLGSSFAFITPIILLARNFGMPYAMGGVVAAGFVYALVAFIIAKIGTEWIDRVLPPVVIGSVIMVIGLGLASHAVQNLAGLVEGASLADPNVQVALFTLAVTVIGTMFFKGFFAVVPILIGVVAGYLFAVLRGIVDFSLVQQAAWFGIPNFSLPKFNTAAIFTMLPVALVTITEHLGDVGVLSTIVGKNFYRKPGLHRTLLGDGLATSLAGFLGGPPNTTYGENVGVLAITGVHNVSVVATAAGIAVAMSFMQKMGALVRTIPDPVMGGVCVVLFGVIAASGIRTLVDAGIDFGDKRNLVISSVILVLGIGGAELSLGPITLPGMPLATLVGIILNLVLPHTNGAEK
ncbi:MAG: uracil permease [Firmicutes bacterium]|jgi:uracil permease|nr:solute carrier family 23 protein [Bacillota bacterium]NLO66173.1 uracil permease [Bacillota bacterium]